MSVSPILEKGDELLEKKSHPVTKFDRRLELLLRDMEETLIDAGGVGLAAPQIGILRRVFIVMDPETEKITHYINPEILERRGEQLPPEGCLSVPGVWGKVRRPAYVRLRAQDKHGHFFEAEGEGLMAQAFDHENDHLNGKLFTDKIVEPIEE
ncbi:MAG TPA: peptide deformylase [Clostridiales bacterium]|jgi:peptide deformylase|nr:peptide deformylase [Clostridiales bacterium]